ncbi:ABC transporter ATP-binding protein [Candidatus Pacearchaeota archaeon]|nr:ABC transporter ATP-binding protein [Candidatus Pacearchaeota archaeon]
MAKKIQNKKNKYKIDFKYNLSIFWSFLKNYKLMWITLLFLVFLSQGKQVLDKFLFKTIIDRGTEFAAGNLAREILIGALLIIGIIFLVLIVFNTLLHWFQLHLLNKLDACLIRDLRKKFFNHIICLDHNFHVTHKTGSLISRLMRGSGAIERMTDVIIFSFAPLILQATIVTISIIYFNWISALTIFLTMGVFILFNIYIQKAQEDSKITLNKTEDLEKGTTADIFTNIDSIKYFGKENLIKTKYKKLLENTKEKFLKNLGYFRWLDAGQSLILGIGTFFVIYFPLMDFLNKQITLGTLTFIYTIYLGLMGPMFSFVHGIRGYYRSMADFQELFEYGKIKKEILDRSNSKKLEIKKGEIEFKNIFFNYGKRKIFEDFNLIIPANKKIALVGHSGCGKTTMIKLLYRFYDIQKGEILIDKKNIKDFKQESLRGEMSMVPQECILFDDTIYNNIAFSNPKASKEEVMKAIKFAQLDRIIKEFPDKEKTIVGERGVKLSGGEKQRVSIARAILANKKILVLDEATSSLDSQTEYDIQRDLKELMRGRTSIIIAHRLSTIMHADKIVVLKKGKIVQMGTHRQLINQQGEYKKLWNLQKGGYIK